MVDTTVNPSVNPSLGRRLLPLHIAVALQGFMLWVPVEKLFMNEIGFDAATVGVMAAAYAALVPLVEIPSGILADRWSRRGVLIVASTALMLTSLVGGLSHSVPLYVVSALFLAVYFAMYSGTMEAVVYDAVLEEAGNSDGFERRLGRVRFVESATLVASSLIYVSRVLHDAVPSTIRSGVVSGVGALSWISFLPFSLVFGQVSKQYGVDTAAWMITGVAVLAAAVLVKVAGQRSDETAGDEGRCGGVAVDAERVPAVSTVAA
jgi:MFS family permease